MIEPAAMIGRANEPLWHPYTNGSTLGGTGSESGVILRDEEHDDGARITLEQGGRIAPFAITCGIYGLMMHTAFASSEPEGVAKYEAMKKRLEALLDGLEFHTTEMDDALDDALQAFCDDFN